MLGLHIPDGFIDPKVAVVAGVIALAAVVLVVRTSRAELDDRRAPLAGMAAAFIFAAQMVNFPVAGGTSGHLIGGALAAVLLGPSVGAVAMTIVVVVQSLLFADGGLTALGLNVLNMAIVTTFGGWAAFNLLRRWIPRTRAGIAAASGLAGGLTVVLSAIAFSLEWLFGATAPVPFDTVFGAMVGVHLVIGIAEGAITAFVVSAVLAVRADLVAGTADLPMQALASGRRAGLRTFGVAAFFIAIGVAAVVSQFASDSPDGLERVAEDTGFADRAQNHALSDRLFADYATDGIGNPTISLALAGLIMAIGVFVNTRIGGLMTVAGSAIAACIAMLWGASEGAINAGLFGFNASLTAIALGGFFFVFDGMGILYTLLGIIITTFTWPAISTLFSPMGMPTLTFPFVLVTWFFLLAKPGLAAVRAVAPANSTYPEDNLRRHRSGELAPGY